MEKKKTGTVYLIGAGPGNPKLITIRGRECINRADIIVYDYLANPRLFSEANPEADKVYVGKRGSDHSVEQDEINELLVQAAKDGKTVARLKGGDAFIFGRGGEEAAYLAKNNIPFEIVPGVSSAYAAPAFAGIPVTYRDLASDVAFITGRERYVSGKPGIAWEMLAKSAGTLVFLMGVKNLPNLVKELQDNGKAETTPVAVIRWGTLADQTTITGTLGNIVEKVREKDLHPPAVIVVGEVVKLRETLAWFEKKPLFGSRIIVTRAAGQAGALTELLEEAGAEVIELPTIKIMPLNDYSLFDSAVSEMSALKDAPVFDWTIFTSVNTVRFLIQRIKHLGFDVRILAKTKIAAVGSATAAELESQNISPDLIPNDFRAEGLISAFEKEGIADKKILIPRALKARSVLPDHLAKLGARVTIAPIYQNVPANPPVDRIIKRFKENAIHVITFSSGSTVRNFVALMSANDCGPELINTAKIATIGPVTAADAKKSGLVVDIMPKDSTIPALVEAIVDARRKD